MSQKAFKFIMNLILSFSMMLPNMINSYAEEGSSQEYKIIFNANAKDARIISSDVSGNTQMNIQSFSDTDTITIYQDAIRENYTLAGWALAADGDVKYLNGSEAKGTDLFAENNYVNLYAVWKSNNWIVKYDLSDTGSWIGEAPVTEYEYSLSDIHQVIENRPASLVPGYVFNGWNVKKESDLSVVLKTVYSNENISAADESLDIQAGDILVLTPAWGEQTYRLTFCANAEDAIIISSDISGDTQYNSQRFTYSETFTIYQDAIRENYTLVGWALTEDGEVKYKNNDTAYFSDVFSDNSFRYLYAVWEPNNKWTLRYDLGDDGYWSGEAPQTQYSYSMSESHIVIDDDPRRTIPGYALRAWKVAKESDPNTIITTVGSGDVISPDDETYNIQIGDALILTPFWLEMTYIVHYYANAEDAVIIGEDISGSTQSNTLKFKYQEKVTVYQDAIRQGYKLAGWALSEDGDIKYKNRQEVTSAELFGEDMYSANLYAVWEPDTSWTVKYELGETGEWDGVAPQTEYVYSLNESHTVISDEPKSKAAGYGFRNWEIRKQSDPETIIATVNDGYEIAPEDETYNIKAGDILIFTPVWYEHSYRITFNKNADDALMIGGDISDGSRPVERYYKYNDTVTIYQEAIRENYILAGWAETEDGEVKYKNGDMTDIPSLFGPIYTKIVLYAVWEKSIPLTGITLNKTSMTLAKGITETLNIVYNPEDTTDDKTVTWKTSDEAVAVVSEHGTVTAVSAGTATITATVGGKSAVCEVTVTEGKEKVEMYRMYNPYTQEHLYTGLEGERDNLVSHGWIYEGFGFYAPKESSTPMYRLYNPNNSDHHYTASEEEIEFCVSNGWIREGICWYADDDKEVAQYRLFNPYIEVGSHHYTYSEEERDFLTSIGWIYEGIGFYTCK